MAGETSREADDSGRATPLSLLERARARDPDAWQRLVQLYRPLVLFWCSSGNVRADDTEDVAQEVLAAAAAALPSFRHDRPGDTFRGWLRVITRNQVIVWHRRNAGRPAAPGGSDAWQVLQEVADPIAGPSADEDVEVGRLYRRALDLVRGAFEEPTWRAFWLTAIEDRSPDALTAELGMSTAAIRQAKSRVLRRIKQEMGELLS